MDQSTPINSEDITEQLTSETTIQHDDDDVVMKSLATSSEPAEEKSKDVEMKSEVDAHDHTQTSETLLDEAKDGIPADINAAVQEETQVKSEADVEVTTARPLTSSDGPELLDREFVEVARANRTDPEAEFEEDSDPAMSHDETTSDSSSSDSSSDSDDDSIDSVIDAAELGRILMRAESPETGGGVAAAPKTLNEEQEKPFDIPTIPGFDENTKLVELGSVFHVISQDNCIMIKAKVDSNYMVLQPGSALCLADRTLIRPVSDTIAQVQQPWYACYFSSAEEIQKFGIKEGTAVYYPDIDGYRSFVFAEELKKQKFTDASNLYDEEVADNEMEFSDDEEERRYKSAKKNARQRNNGDHNNERMNRGGRGGRGQPRGGRGGSHFSHSRTASDASPYIKSERFDPDAPASQSNASQSMDTPIRHDTLDYDGDYNLNKRPDNYGSFHASSPSQASVAQSTNESVSSEHHGGRRNGRGDGHRGRGQRRVRDGGRGGPGRMEHNNVMHAPHQQSMPVANPTTFPQWPPQPPSFNGWQPPPPAQFAIPPGTPGWSPPPAQNMPNYGAPPMSWQRQPQQPPTGQAGSGQQLLSYLQAMSGNVPQNGQSQPHNSWNQQNYGQR